MQPITMKIRGVGALLSVLLFGAGCDAAQSRQARPVRKVGLAAATVSASAVEYVYDGAGNLAEVRPAITSEMSIAEVQPDIGAFGDTVIVTGTGFDPVSTGNAVSLSGVPAFVTAATSTELRFVVPFGAITGRISVTSGQRSAGSATDFVVASPVHVTGFTPTIGKAGTELTITGVNFDPSTQFDSVSIGGSAAAVVSATPTTLKVTAGEAASSGKVSVVTRWGAGTSEADFFVPPASVAPAYVGSTGRITIGGSSTAVSLPVTAKKGLLIFSGVAGQSVSLFVTGNTLAGSTSITCYSPTGATLISGNAATGVETKLKVGVLPASGTYSIVIAPYATSTGQLSMRLFEDAAATVEVDGAPGSLTMAAGQNGRFSFQGAAGETLTFAVTEVSSTPAGSTTTFTFTRPDGTSLYGFTSYNAGAAAKLPVLPVTGTYALAVSPPGTAAGSATVVLSRPILGALAVDGATVRFASARPGQIGQYAFPGTAGQRLTMQATADATFSGTVKVYRPDGSQGASGNANPGTSIKMDLGSLPTTGNYRVEVIPTGVNTGAVDLRLATNVVGTIVVDGPPTAVTLGTAQNGRYSFAGNAGDRLSMAIPSLSTSPSGGTVSFTFYKPDGVSFYNYAFYNPAVVAKLAYALPVTGAYVLAVTPPGTASASASVLLSRPITGTLPVDGTAVQFATTRPGQMGQYTFAGTAEQYWTVEAIADATYAGVVTAFRPDWTQILNVSVPKNGGVRLDLGRLAQSGQHFIEVTPTGLVTGAVNLRLVPYAVGQLQIGAQAALTLGRSQIGRFTFEGSAGDLLNLAVSSISTVPSGSAVVLSILKPDGSTHFSSSFTSARTATFTSALPVTGTYTLKIVPAGTASANVVTQLVRR